MSDDEGQRAIEAAAQAGSSAWARAATLQASGGPSPDWRQISKTTIRAYLAALSKETLRSWNNTRDTGISPPGLSEG